MSKYRVPRTATDKFLYDEEQKRGSSTSGSDDPGTRGPRGYTFITENPGDKSIAIPGHLSGPLADGSKVAL